MPDLLPRNPSEALSKITIGIRHQRHFGIMDSSGRIVDIIAKDSDSPFGKGFFTQIGMGVGRERRISTADGGSYIDVTTDDLIFQYTLPKDKDFNAAFNWVVDTCLPFFKDKILKPHHVTEYQRLGIIFGHRLPAPHAIDEMLTSLTSKMSDPETLMLRVSKKLAVPQALAMKGVDDYRNVILTLNKSDAKQLEADVDIQHYFNPFPDNLDDFKGYPSFFREAKELLFSTYHPMLAERFFPKPLGALA